MAIQYAIIEGQGHLLIGWDWQIENNTQGAEITASYSVWFVPGTTDVSE